MSFSEECVRFGDRLAKLVDAGVPVREAASRWGVSRQQAYAILRAVGRPMGVARPDVSGVDRGRVAAVFTATGSVNAAAKAVAVAHSTARRMLVEQGLVDAVRQVRGKPAARARFFELLEAGWSTVRAAREVEVHVRTARDWRAGIRQVGNTRVYPDGTVHDYGTGTRYTQPVRPGAGEHNPAPVEESVSRCLRLSDRLVIADQLTAGLSHTAIADMIGRHKSTVSREIARHSVEGLYLPYQADAAAAQARSRPKESKLVINQKLRTQVQQGLAKRWSPEEISHRLVKDFRTTKACG